MSLGVAIIGCGLIGQKRAMALGTSPLVALYDSDRSRALQLQKLAPSARVHGSTEELLADPDVGVVIVATRHDSLARLTAMAIEGGKHVLVEKPAARRAAELDGLAELAAQRGVKVRVGFNHRYHRGLRKARQLVDEGAIGPLMYIRARYGHGGRLGYEGEWRADARISGGGELIDQGPHLIDLSRWFLGDFTQIDGHAATFFWKMKVDDNGFMLLRTEAGAVSFLHASCTEWKNLFSFEIFGRDGKIEVAGLGGSYGTERITHYRMLPEMGPPQTTSWEYPMADDSWQAEFAAFLEDLATDRAPDPGLADAAAALRIVEAIYRKSGYDPDP